jgi:hypothetical protein
MALARISLAMRRSASVENRPDRMVCSTFGLTPAVSTRAIKPNSRALSTLCFAGTVVLLDAMFICRMSLVLPSTLILSAIYGRGNRISGKVDGSPQAGRSKSSLPRLPSNSSPGNASDLVTRVL